MPAAATVASLRSLLPTGSSSASRSGSHFLGGGICHRVFRERRAAGDSFVVYGARRDGSDNGNGKKVPRFGTPFPDGNSEIESPVPWDQLPINEFNNLHESRYFSWAVESIWLYSMKLGAVGTCCMLLGWPVASLSVSPESWKCCIGALSAGLMGATLAALRLYLGWSHVGNRLFSVAVDYEETGWYDGQTWIKPPEVLARDRLVGSYTVKPALNRVKLTLIGLAVSLSACALLLFTVPEASPPLLVAEPQQEFHGSFTRGYSEDSAKRYEPDAFTGDETGEVSAGASGNLPDYCTTTGVV